MKAGQITHEYTRTQDVNGISKANRKTQAANQKFFFRQNFSKTFRLFFPKLYTLLLHTKYTVLNEGFFSITFFLKIIKKSNVRNISKFLIAPLLTFKDYLFTLISVLLLHMFTSYISTITFKIIQT